MSRNKFAWFVFILLLISFPLLYVLFPGASRFWKDARWT